MKNIKMRICSIILICALIVGGTIPSCIAFIEIIASTAPAPPNMCPVIDFVDETDNFEF